MPTPAAVHMESHVAGKKKMAGGRLVSQLRKVRMAVPSAPPAEGRYTARRLTIPGG